jgi:hypothetical protein
MAIYNKVLAGVLELQRMGSEMKTLKKMTLVVLTVALPGWLGTASTSAHADSFQSNDWSVQ